MVYTYNWAGMLTQDRVTVGSHTLRHQYQYDRRGLLTIVGISHATTGTFSQILTLDYDIAGAVTERHLGTQTSVPYAYDVAGRIHTIGDVTSTTDPFAALYSYTPSGLIALMDTRSGAAAQNCSFSTEVCSDRWTYTFSYDGLARLTGATYMPVPPFISSGSQFTVNDISYDPQGNIETLIRNAPTTGNPYGAPVDNLTYTYTARTNRLESVADAVETDLDWDAKSQIPFAGPSTFQYNRVGSMTQMTETLTSTSFRETEVQRYNERQLPEEMQIRLFVAPGGMVEATQVSYRYDANGQRISKHVRPAPVIGGDPPRAGSIVQERYVRDGMRLIGVFDENNELKSWNIGGVAGLVGRAIPDPRAFQPVPLYYMTDHLGSIRAVLNASGTVVEGRDYYPYGLTMPGRFYVQADTTREGFTGYEQDKETGFYYAGARFYNPALARWFVTDRFQELYPGLSPYQYASGNPVLVVDVNGDSLYVEHTYRTGFLGIFGRSVSERAVYRDGGWYIAGTGQQATMRSRFASSTARAVDRLNQTETGSRLVSALANDSRDVTIVKGSRNTFSPDEQNSIIEFNPRLRDSGPNEAGNTQRPSFIGLGHEFAHGYDYYGHDGIQGLTIGLWGAIDTPSGSRNIGLNEKYASIVENMIRAEAGIPLRTHYDLNLNSGTGTLQIPKVLPAWFNF